MANLAVWSHFENLIRFSYYNKAIRLQDEATYNLKLFAFISSNVQTFSVTLPSITESVGRSYTIIHVYILYVCAHDNSKSYGQIQIKFF